MTQHDPEAFLDLARQALAPRDVDHARVLSLLEQQLDLPSNDAANELHSMQASLPGLSHGGPSTLLRWALGAVIPLAGVAAVSVLLATRSAAPKVPVLRPVTKSTPAVVETSVLDLSIAQPEEAREPKAPAVEPVVPPKEKKPQRKKCRTPQGSDRPCAPAKPTETAIANDPPPSAAAPASSLSKELAALREAQRALREGRAAEALTVLTTFEQGLEGPGAMQEERHAAATMARCALARRGETKTLYDDFMQRYPNSAYAQRLQRSCRPKSAR